jgi:hypothetical protein
MDSFWEQSGGLDVVCYFLVCNVYRKEMHSRF